MGYGIKWPSKGNYGGVNFHGMFMATSLVYFQGEALLSYRFHRYEAKYLSKFLHTVFHLMVIAFFTVALAAIIVHKNLSVSLSQSFENPVICIKRSSSGLVIMDRIVWMLSPSYNELVVHV
ncbi:hypothetical protein OESDEN_22270 [Oesophagostomum dentatum]|uniref:Cytochrome b561 domain-containing protein n=1 Tax=Oesophagostomum dentatum TaxID=61180 RepID=A0A0B1S4H9_OESDE|nr:hypothetical protein OESDEN_22270 [Oesophagostomum dentatum]